mmetsp:Transcript_33307/g.76875  ORF Transcript_33307/g.76875 Transcript_33307/m.76875 type:complete len:241 (-) Transcript_33307:510-1232(-)
MMLTYHSPPTPAAPAPSPSTRSSRRTRSPPMTCTTCRSSPTGFVASSAGRRRGVPLTAMRSLWRRPSHTSTPPPPDTSPPSICGRDCKGWESLSTSPPRSAMLSYFTWPIISPMSRPVASASWNSIGPWDGRAHHPPPSLPKMRRSAGPRTRTGETPPLPMRKWRELGRRVPRGRETLRWSFPPVPWCMRRTRPCGCGPWWIMKSRTGATAAPWIPSSLSFERSTLNILGTSLLKYSVRV